MCGAANILEHIFGEHTRSFPGVNAQRGGSLGHGVRVCFALVHTVPFRC